MTPLDTTAARLEGLLERATKGPFDFMEGPNRIRALRGDLAVPLFEIRDPYCDPEMPVPTVRLGGKVVSRANSMAARDTASIRQGRANGRFLLEVLNALPALLSERRALKAEVERLQIELAKEAANHRATVKDMGWQIHNLEAEVEKLRDRPRVIGRSHSQRRRT